MLSRAAGDRRGRRRPRRPLQVPVDYSKLPNGLKVVLSRDTTAPMAVVAVYYNIGFRIEPKDRTGFAHLFEHMMFQGSENLGKMEFIKLVQSNGGVLNGSTRFDFTNYFEVVPAHALETALWAEADRMKGLAITADNLKNQQEVVKNEVKVNVLNQPYGGFPWLDLPQYANTNWYNAHNFYGDLKDLDAATLEDVAELLQDLLRAEQRGARRRRRLRSGADEGLGREVLRRRSRRRRCRRSPTSPSRGRRRRSAPPRTTSSRRGPALAIGYHAPPRNTPEYYAMGLLDQILVQGKDSRLYQALVQKNGLTGDVDGGINSGLGDMFNINGPTLWDVSLFYDKDKTVRPDPQGLRRRDREGAHDAGRPGDARPRAREDALRPLRQDGAVRRLRPGRPARLLRALRRRPGKDQPDRGGVPQGHAGADAEDGAGVPAARATARSCVIEPKGEAKPPKSGS